MPQAQQGLVITDTAQIVDGIVATDDLANLAVTTAKLAADAVDNTKLADNAVQVENLADNAVGDAEIASHTTTKITVPTSRLSVASEAQGDILIRDASGWTRLAAGTSGQFLRTNGAAANASWATLSSMAKAAIVPKAVTVSNTSTETDLINFTLGANELSTANMVFVKLCISNLQSNTADTITIRCYYGATSIAFTARDIANVDGEGYIDFYIGADGATNDQQLTAQIHTSRSGQFTNATHDDLKETVTGAAAIDSTQAQTVKITAQWSGIDASDVITVGAGFAYIIK